MDLIKYILLCFLIGVFIQFINGESIFFEEATYFAPKTTAKGVYGIYKGHKNLADIPISNVLFIRVQKKSAKIIDG